MCAREKEGEEGVVVLRLRVQKPGLWGRRRNPTRDDV